MQFINKWHEFSGGSRPGSNKIGFFEEEDGYRLQISYIFDWDTEERVDMSFNLGAEEFLTLVSELLEKGQATLSKEEGEESLHFEWRTSDGKLRFRLQGRGLSPIEGYVRHRMMNFQTILLDQPLQLLA